MIGTLLSMAAPLMLAGLGGLLTEIAGSLGIFLEGFMTIGSFVAWSATKATGSPLLGCLAAGIPAAGLGWGLAKFVRATGANAFIAALALNLAAEGTAETLSSIWYGTKGVLADPAVGALDPAVFISIAWAATAMTAIFVARTRAGLRLRAAGKDPETLRERGVDPDRYRAAAWAAAAAMAGLGGAALTFRVGAYAPGGIAGRGWLALVAVYLGFRNAWGVAAAALVFAAAEFAASIAQGTGAVPATILLGLPSALALVFFAASSALRRKKKRLQQ